MKKNNNKNPKIKKNKTKKTTTNAINQNKREY